MDKLTANLTDEIELSNLQDNRINTAAVGDTRLRDLNANTLELLAEVPQVAKERVVTGNVKLSKQVKTQIINVPVTLTQEILVIEHQAQPQSLQQDELVKVIHDNPALVSTITIDGKPVTLDDNPIEIVLSQQIAKVAIETQVTENVKVVTTTQTYEETIPVTLRHEELVTEEVKLDDPRVISSSVVDTNNNLK